MTSAEELKFNQILDEYGHYVLVLHREKKIKCPRTREVCPPGEEKPKDYCVDPATGSVDRSCPYCFGLGYIPLIKKYKTRRIDGAISDTVPRSGNVQNFGAMYIENKHYYFPKDVPISEMDLIIEVEWNGIQPVYKNRGVFEVSHVHHFRYKGGNTLYQKVSVKDKPVNKFIRGFQITKRAGEIAYRLAEGK